MYLLTSSGSRMTCSCTGACSWGIITGLSGLRKAWAILRVRSISFFQPNILLMTFMSPNRLVMTLWFGLPLTLLKMTGQPPSRRFCSPVTSRSGSTGLSVSIKSPCDFSHSNVFRRSTTSAVSDWAFSLGIAFCMTSELQCFRDAVRLLLEITVVRGSGRGRLRLATRAAAMAIERPDDDAPEFVSDLSEPNGVDVGPRVDVLFDLVEGFPAPTGYFERIRNGCAVEAAAEDMHDFVFDQAVGYFGAVIHRKHKSERAADAHLFEEPSNSGVNGVLTGTWM